MSGAIVRLNGQAGVVGSGFLLSGGFVMTCAHVVATALGKGEWGLCRPGDRVTVDLVGAGKLGLPAEVVVFHEMVRSDRLFDDPVADIAVLRLIDATPLGGIDALQVTRHPIAGERITAFGFPVGLDNGTIAGGEVLVEDGWNWLQVVEPKGEGRFLEPGFSGSAAMAIRGDRPRLIGMVSQVAYGDARLGMLISSEVLCRAWPLLARPYRGLEAFDASSADLFHGRDGFVAELSAKIGRHPFALVVGPSGSGKSSVVKAGLVPRLAAEGWAVVQCRPGLNPLRELASGLLEATLGSALSATDPLSRQERAEEWAERLRAAPERILDLAPKLGNGRPMLLVIAQFEELFTRDAEAGDGSALKKEETDSDHGSPRQRDFLRVLEKIAGQEAGLKLPIRAVATLRADFVDAALKIGVLARLMRNADVKLGPLDSRELTEAIEAPARRFGVTFEPGLVAEIVSEMKGRPGGLPLLQFALDRLWRRQERQPQARGADRMVLTAAAYRGPDGRSGLESALDDHAEAVRQEIGDDARLKRVMLRLVRVEEGQPDTRAVVPRSVFGVDEWELVERLANERLVMIASPEAGESTAEVVHEALIGAWGQLAAWLDEDRAFRHWQQRLADALREHRMEPEGTLLSGRRLAEAEGWLASHRDRLERAEAEFIALSRQHVEEMHAAALREAEQRTKAAEEQAEQERQLREEAEKAQTDAEQGRADAERARAEAVTARTAAEAANTRSRRRLRYIRATLALVVLLALGVAWYARREVGLKADVQLALDGEKKALVKETEARNAADAAAELEKQARERADLAAREAKGRQLGAEAAYAAGPGRNPSLAAALAIEGWKRYPTVAASDAAQRLLRGLPSVKFKRDYWTNAVAFNPDGALLATASSDNSARLVWTTDGTELERIQHNRPVDAVAFSPNGALLATASEDGTARLVRTTDGTELTRIEHDRRVNAVAFGPDGALLATASMDKTARLIRTTDGAELERVEHGDDVTAVAFSPDGALLATASDDNTARLVRTTDGTELTRIEHDDDVTTVAFSPDGALLATASKDGTVRLTLLPPDRWFTDLCDSRIARNLTTGEWSQYIGASEPWAQTCENWEN